MGSGICRVKKALVHRDVNPVTSPGSGAMWDADTQGLYGKEGKNSCEGQLLEATSAAFYL